MVAFHVNLDLVDYAKKEEGRNKMEEEEEEYMRSGGSHVGRVGES